MILPSPIGHELWIKIDLREKSAPSEIGEEAPS